MKFPHKALRTLLLLPDNFVGSVTVHSNGHGVFTVEVRHQERYSAAADEMIDLTPHVSCRALLGKGPRRG